MRMFRVWRAKRRRRMMWKILAKQQGYGPDIAKEYERVWCDNG